MLQILCTDRNLNVVGDPLIRFTNITSILRHRGVSAGTFTAPAYPGLLDQVDPDPTADGYSGERRIVLIRDGQIWDAGPIVDVEIRRSVEGEDSGAGRVTVTWAGDMLWIAGRLVYPNPAQTAGSQTADRYTYSGNAETAIRNLVNLNAGPGALTARRVPRLILGDVAGVGGNIKVSARFSPLADEIRSAAIAGGDLGFRTRQVDDDIVFDVYEPQDLTGQVRFSWGLGNLREAGYKRTLPTATVAIVGAQGEGADRDITEHINTPGATNWGRVEVWADRRDTDDTDTIDQAGEETLLENAERAQLSTVTVDTDTQRYGVHYELGDRVSIEYRPGREVADVVQAVQLEADATGLERVTATVGTQEASADPTWVRLLRRINRQVKYLQANAETAGG